jgi:hypothetical protein
MLGTRHTALRNSLQTTIYACSLSVVLGMIHKHKVLLRLGIKLIEVT